LAGVVPAGKLRFLQYVRPESLDWWTAQEERGAILLGKTTKRAEEATSEESLRKAKRSAAAKKAWETIRRNQAKTAPALPPTAALNHNPNLAKEAQSTSSGAIPPETPGKKAWETMRRRYTPEQIKARAQAAAKKAWVTIRAKNK